jgi:UDP-N-acetylmuramyl pentapeptide phosphotransferase/UDP-N-acetylglucosamine-1-phosphate transferase
VALGLDVIKHVAQVSLFIDYKGGANRAHVLLALHALFSIGTVGLLDRVVMVTQKLKVLALFLLEALQLLWFIWRDAQDRIAQ